MLFEIEIMRMNEPRQVGNVHEWWYADDECCHEALECITEINQAAVDGQQTGFICNSRKNRRGSICA